MNADLRIDADPPGKFGYHSTTNASCAEGQQVQASKQQSSKKSASIHKSAFICVSSSFFGFLFGENLFQVESDTQCRIHLGHLRRRQRSDVLREVRFSKTYQVVAHNPAWMLEPLIQAYFHLRSQTFAAAEHRSANCGREFGRDERLPADNEEDTKLLGVAARFVNSIQLATLHRLTRPRTDSRERRPLQR